MLSPRTIYYWKKMSSEQDPEGMKHQMLKQREQQIKNLRKEKEILIQLLAEKWNRGS